MGEIGGSGDWESVGWEWKPMRVTFDHDNKTIKTGDDIPVPSMGDMMIAQGEVYFVGKVIYLYDATIDSADVYVLLAKMPRKLFLKEKKEASR